MNSNNQVHQIIRALEKSIQMNGNRPIVFRYDARMPLAVFHLQNALNVDCAYTESGHLDRIEFHPHRTSLSSDEFRVGNIGNLLQLIAQFRCRAPDLETIQFPAP